GLVIARGGRLPVCCNYIEYYFADSAGASSVDHGLAPVSGSVVGNCGGAGGHDSVAADEEKGVNRAARAKFFTTREHRGHRETQGPASSTALCRNLRRGKPRLYRSFTSTRDRYSAIARGRLPRCISAIRGGRFARGLRLARGRATNGSRLQPALFHRLRVRASRCVRARPDRACIRARWLLRECPLRRLR